jgi:hypothetical protein
MPPRRTGEKPRSVVSTAFRASDSSSGASAQRANLWAGLIVLVIIVIAIIIGRRTVKIETSSSTSGAKAAEANKETTAKSTTTKASTKATAKATTEAAEEAAEEAGETSTSPDIDAIDPEEASPDEDVLAEIDGRAPAIGDPDTKENMAGADIANEGRKARKALKENAVADEIKKLGKQVRGRERAVADEIQDAGRAARKRVRNEKFVANDGSNQAINVFVDRTGFGRVQFPDGGVARQPDHKFYPVNNRRFAYQKVGTGKGMARTAYPGPGGKPVPFNSIVSQMHRRQDAQALQGFEAKSSEIDRYFHMQAGIRSGPDGSAGDLSAPPYVTATKVSPTFQKYIGGGKERALANDMATTDHDFNGSRSLSNGISGGPQLHDGPRMGLTDNLGPKRKKVGGLSSSGYDPDANLGPPNSDQRAHAEADADVARTNVRASVKKIIKLFDRLIGEEIFPHMVIDTREDGTIFFRDGKEGPCIRMDRYYEYVQASVKSSLQLGDVGQLVWGRSLSLGFENIEENKFKLREALRARKCTPAQAYILRRDMELRTSDGRPIRVVIPWPKDQSTLISHSMTLRLPDDE